MSRSIHLSPQPVLCETNHNHWQMPSLAVGGPPPDADAVLAMAGRHDSLSGSIIDMSWLQGLAMLCMAADPEQRPTAKAIVRALGRLANPNEFQVRDGAVHASSPALPAADHMHETVLSALALLSGAQILAMPADRSFLPAVPTQITMAGSRRLTFPAQVVCSGTKNVCSPLSAALPAHAAGGHSQGTKTQKHLLKTQHQLCVQGGTLDNGKSSQRRPRSWKRVPSFKRLSWRRARDESARDERSSPTEAASGSEAPRHGSAASSRPDWTIGTAKSRKSEQQQRDAQENAENQPQAASSGAQGPAADPAPFRIPEETPREHAASPREQMSSPREHAGSPRKSTTSPRPPRGSPQGRAVHGTPQGKAPHSRRSHQSTPQSSRSEGAVSTGHKRVVQAAAEEDGKAHPQGWLLCC